MQNFKVCRMCRTEEGETFPYFILIFFFQGLFEKIPEDRDVLNVSPFTVLVKMCCFMCSLLLYFFFSDEEFQQLQQSFMEKHYLEFENSEENKLSYTAIFNEYVSRWVSRWDLM